MSEIQPSQSRTRRPFVLAATMLAMFMAAVEATIVATAMPTIIAELGGFQLFSWVFAIYLLTQAVSIPIYGKLADMFGRKPAFYAGAALFLVGSALAGFSSGMIWLILFRALQGLGAGAIMPIASTIVADIYTPAERGKVQGYLSSVWGVAAVIGPALGAFFVEHVGWPYVFWVNLPIGVVTIALLAVFLHEDVKHHSHQVDYLGACLLMLGTTAFMLALIQGTSLPLTGVLALLVGSALSLGFFFHVERRTLEPMIPLELWRHRVIAAGNMGQVATGAVMIGTAIFVPTYVQGVLGGSAAAAGIAVGAMSLAWPIASVFAGKVILNASFRLAAVVGALLLIAGSVVLCMLTPERGLIFASGGAFLVGLGMGFSNLTYLVAVQTSVDWRRRGIATSLNLFMRMVGQSVGTACFGALVNFGVARFAMSDPEIVNRMMDPSVRRTIDPGTLERVSRAMAASLHDVYLIVLLLSIAALVIATRIPGELNAKNAIQASKPA